ncbi:hypothetical protein [Marinicellulosiphila megalodicopiae]|uniref:hypothetical protein n=1 Tax=Marinicellulosiphila megalodicopiae TaxID=2724896 RepID=UPI003BB071DC
MLNWNKLASRSENNLIKQEIKNDQSIAQRSWLKYQFNHCEGNYALSETEHFMLLSGESEKYINVFKQFLESALTRILKSLNGLAVVPEESKFLIIILKDIDDYYDYVSQFYPEDGEFGLSSGVFINDEQPHLVFYSQELDFAEPIAMHELAHACLSHLDIPVWLNEGLAVLMEQVHCNIPFMLDEQVMFRHKQYWTADKLDAFFSGDSFLFADEGQELSYHLACLIVRNISSDLSTFVSFANHAHFKDSGESASKQYLGFSVMQYVYSIVNK